MFYLPVVTPWWFTNVVVHLIRTMARAHDVHVLIAPLWRSTGIGEEQVDLIADMGHVFWHLLDGPDHPVLRSDASDQDDLFDLVDAIDPQLVLCRSADIATPARFPGVVRYIMEGAAPPLRTAANWVYLAPTLFDYGVMPQLSEEQAAKLDELAAPLWAEMHAQIDWPSKENWLAQTGLRSDKCIIGLPLEYEHEENFFGQHHRYPNNAEMIAGIAAKLGNDHVLAVTNHPLNELYSDNRAVEQAIVASAGKAALLDSSEVPGDATLALSKHCDGMVVGNSKSWSACAALGTPIARLSDFATGTWVNAKNDVADLLTAVGQNAATPPDPAQGKRWFAFHLANNAFDPTDPALNADDLIARMSTPVDPVRWEPALSRYRARQWEVAA